MLGTKMILNVAIREIPSAKEATMVSLVAAALVNNQNAIFSSKTIRFM